MRFNNNLYGNIVMNCFSKDDNFFCNKWINFDY